MQLQTKENTPSLNLSDLECGDEGERVAVSTSEAASTQSTDSEQCLTHHWFNLMHKQMLTTFFRTHIPWFNKTKKIKKMERETIFEISLLNEHGNNMAP